jgi:hypothetical protein
MQQPVPARDLQHVFERLLSSHRAQNCPAAFRSQAWTLLKDLYLPSASQSKNVNNRTTAYSWLHAACQLRAESSFLDKSLLAFSAIQVYIAEPWSTSKDIALQFYNEALLELAQALDKPEDRSSNETLATIVVLSTCEVRKAYTIIPYSRALTI